MHRMPKRKLLSFRAKIVCNGRMPSRTTLLRLNFTLALVAMLGGLYFGEVLKFPPCTFCWYQRICMYPLVAIFGAALWSGDDYYHRPALPLSLTGLVLAGYHNLLYYGVISGAIVPCQQGVSCVTRQVELLGFVTIPLMSLMSFAVINALMFLHLKAQPESAT